MEMKGKGVEELGGPHGVELMQVEDMAVVLAFIYKGATKKSPTSWQYKIMESLLQPHVQNMKIISR